MPNENSRRNVTPGDDSRISEEVTYNPPNKHPRITGDKEENKKRRRMRSRNSRKSSLLKRKNVSPSTYEPQNSWGYTENRVHVEIEIRIFVGGATNRRGRMAL